MLALAGWGLWQVNAFRHAYLQNQGREETPDLAVGSAIVTPIGAQGGEPWAQAMHAAGSTIQGLDTSPDTLPSFPALPDASAGAPVSLQPIPTFDAALTADELMNKGTALLDSGDAVAGRFALNAALSRSRDESQSLRLRQMLTSLNVPVFLGTDMLPDDPCVRFVEVESGDSFLKIGRTWGIPAAFVESLNPGLSPRNLKPSAGVKIVQGPFHLRIIKHAQRVDLYAREIFICSLAIDFPEGNFLPNGDYEVTAGTKLQLGSRTWIGFEGLEPATEQVTAGWIFASAGPRGNTPRDRATGIHLADSDLQELYNVLVEGRSHIRVEP